MDISCEAIAEKVGKLFSCSTINEAVRIRTPFLYPDGDVIDIFIEHSNNVLIITDFGETLRWLRMQTTALRRSRKQNALINNICMNHNVEFLNGSIMLRLNPEDDLGAAVIRLSQAALRVSDLWFTMRNRTFDSIIEEVEEFLTEQHIPHERGAKFVGRSTQSWKIDFYTKHPQRTAFVAVLSTASQIAAQNITNNIVAQWSDLSDKKVTEDIRFISLFDDTTDVWQQSNFKQLEELSEVFTWSHRDEFKERLTA